MRVPIKAVIFDLDGTITKFTLDYLPLRAEVRKMMREAGVPNDIVSPDDHIFNVLEKVQYHFQRQGRPEIFRELRRSIEEIFVKYEREAARKTELLPNVMQTLRSLRDMELKIGLFTVDGIEETMFVLNKFKIIEFFDAIVTRERAPKVKPNALHLKVTLDRIGVNPGEAIVVGDHVIDILPCKELGAIGIGVTTGVRTREQLMAAGAMRVIDSLGELVDVIRSLNT